LQPSLNNLKKNLVDSHWNNRSFYYDWDWWNNQQK
jgi:hypothetical protein